MNTLKMHCILWGLSYLFKRALSQNTAFKDYLGDKQLDFQIQTQSGKGRFFSLHNSGMNSNSITNRNTLQKQPIFSIVFINAMAANSILTSKDKNAFLKGIQDKNIRIQGDLNEVLWFQGLLKFLKRKR